MTVIGTRPEIIKMSALLPLLDSRFDHVLVHSGQHYSPNMDRVFFEELGLRDPDRFLEVGSRPPGAQTAAILNGVEELLLETRPDAVVVHGDTNTTLGAALATCKYPAIRLVHVEAGARSGNPLQPEEINRKLVDRVSGVHFVLRQEDVDNLVREGIDTDGALVTGSTVFDSCARAVQLPGADLPGRFGLSAGGYALATFHRQETVDERRPLGAVCRAIARISAHLPVIVPLHPRTRKRVDEFGLDHATGRVTVVEPLGYGAMMGLLGNARLCLTDSGGLMEEAAILGVPALVLRNETEHRAYLDCGIHRLVGTNEGRIVAEAQRLLNDDAEHRRRSGCRPSPPAHSPSKVIADEIARLLGVG